MSAFEINRICRDVLKDHGFRAAMQRDVASALIGADLTPAEREAFINGDVVALYRAGANTFLLYYLTRFEIAGLTLLVYNQRMRAAADQ